MNSTRSLWRFNAKYDPVWHPRYWVYDAPEHVPAAALAVVRSESVWELPLIGRFLRPPADDPVEEAPPVADGGAQATSSTASGADASRCIQGPS